MEPMPELTTGASGNSRPGNPAHSGLAEFLLELKNLQRIAHTVSLPVPPPTLLTLRVLFVAGSEAPWRLLETLRSGGRTKMNVLCFGSLEKISRCLQERCAWQRADADFVANHMSTPGGFPGVTADWVPSRDFELVFRPQRNAIRRALCTTSPDYTLIRES